MKKQDLYAAMIERMREADAAGFHLEASWLAYAILEDRTSSMLRALGKPPRPKDALYDKTVALAWRAGEKDGALGVYFRDGVLTTSEPGDKATAKGRVGKKKRKSEAERNEDRAQVAKFPFLAALAAFREKRNALTHSMAVGDIALATLDAAAKDLSTAGLGLVKAFSTIARKVKRHSKHL